MWKLFWKLYKKWLLVCGALIVISLGTFFVFFRVQYPKLRQDNIRAVFEDLEATIRDNEKYSDQLGKLPRDKRLPTDVDYELALRTVQRMRQLVESGQLEYQDFAKLRYLNQLPLNRRVMGREYNRLFQEMNRVMDQKLAGELGRPGEAAAGRPVPEAADEAVISATGEGPSGAREPGGSSGPPGSGGL